MAPPSQYLPLFGKVALITGSSRNIGASVAKRLAASGANVVINYTGNAKAAEETVDEIKKLGAGRPHPIKADVSSVAGAKQLVEDTVKAFGKIDILVLNAGIMGSQTLSGVDEQFYDSHFNINVKGPFFLTQAAVPHMKEGSRIIFFSSALTIQSAITPNYLVYVATKGAIEQLSRVLSKELGAKGISVNAVSPGPTATSLFFEGKSEEVINHMKGISPFNRLGTPEDVAGAVLFLAGPDAAWVSGQNLRVTGASIV